jgi:acyl transferase domain-containing protein
MGFLSPDSRCYSFDDRANGYARGEGCGVVVIKRVSDAIRDGDTIRAIIRSSGSNQDGHTPGLTQPSRDSQASLIRETYEKAGLDFSTTRFFEAHGNISVLLRKDILLRDIPQGTGTTIGDPTEADAIGSVFRRYRSPADPLYM